MHSLLSATVPVGLIPLLIVSAALDTFLVPLMHTAVGILLYRLEAGRKYSDVKKGALYVVSTLTRGSNIA